MDSPAGPRRSGPTIGDMIRLDPAHPPLWRTPTVLQFGRQSGCVLDDPPLWQLQFIRELEKGVPDSAVASLARSLGAPPGAADTLLDRLRPVLLDAATRTPQVLILSAPDASAARIDEVSAGLRGAGAVVRTAADPPPPGEGVDAVILLAAHALHPRRAAVVHSRDLAHLPIVLGFDSAEVGPLVTPGASACLQCLAAHQRDRDPAWPALTAQLVGRTGQVGPAAIAVEAGLHAGRMLISARTEQTLTLSAGAADARLERWGRHPECSCGSPAGNATVTDLESRSTTTARAYAVPA